MNLKLRKGIILAGGLGSRLYPNTLGTSKQLLPVYDKPLIYYPLSTLLLTGVKDILIISNPDDKKSFQKLLGDGKRFGVNISYAVQPKPDGIAQAFIIAEKFLKKSPSVLILGDNIFLGEDLKQNLVKANNSNGATIFAYEVHDPERYGVINFDKKNNPISIIEKPKISPSNFAITGIYFYDEKVVEIAKSLKPSQRGELEITDINKHYLNSSSLYVSILGRGMTWLDAGTQDSLLEASNLIKAIQKRQGILLSCPEEIALNENFISKSSLLNTINSLKECDYKNYLKKVLDT